MDEAPAPSGAMSLSTSWRLWRKIEKTSPGWMESVSTLKLVTRLRHLEKSAGATRDCCPCPKLVIILEESEPIPAEYARPCPVNCPCHRDQIRIIQYGLCKPRND